MIFRGPCDGNRDSMLRLGKLSRSKRGPLDLPDGWASSRVQRPPARHSLATGTEVRYCAEVSDQRIAAPLPGPSSQPSFSTASSELTGLRRDRCTTHQRASDGPFARLRSRHAHSHCRQGRYYHPIIILVSDVRRQAVATKQSPRLSPQTDAQRRRQRTCCLAKNRSIGVREGPIEANAPTHTETQYGPVHEHRGTTLTSTTGHWTVACDPASNSDTVAPGPQTGGTRI